MLKSLWVFYADCTVLETAINKNKEKAYTCSFLLRVEITIEEDEKPMA